MYLSKENSKRKAFKVPTRLSDVSCSHRRFEAISETTRRREKGHVNCDEEKQGHTVTLSSPALTDTGRPLAAAYEELQGEIRGFHVRK